jgi:hypothetical protein
MATPITFPTLPQGLPYCSPADVNSLLGNLASSVPAQSMANAIASATSFMSSQTNRHFTPRRVIRRYDGNGRSRMVLADDHLIAVNQLSVYFSYPLSLARIANDWDLLLDRAAGIISFAIFTASPIFAPFSFTFYPGSQNVEVDAWFGFTQNVYTETLTTSDNTTYTFANPTALRQTSPGSAYPYSTPQPPAITPFVYKNGTLLANTVYEQVQTTDQAPTPLWEVQTDNVYYTLNANASGLSGVTFNSANSPSDVITADYAYWEIPADVTEATAKKAAIVLLQGLAQTGFPAVEYMGAVQVAIDGSRLQYGVGGQFDGIIGLLTADINAVIKQRKRPYMGEVVPISGGALRSSVAL